MAIPYVGVAKFTNKEETTCRLTKTVKGVKNIWRQYPDNPRYFVNAQGLVVAVGDRRQARILFPRRIFSKKMNKPWFYYNLKYASERGCHVTHIEKIYYACYKTAKNFDDDWYRWARTVVEGLARQRKKKQTGSSSQYLRKCHDCGRPTNNYRCDVCWEKLRAKYDAPDTVCDVWLDRVLHTPDPIKMAIIKEE